MNRNSIIEKVTRNSIIENRKSIIDKVGYHCPSVRGAADSLSHLPLGAPSPEVREVGTCMVQGAGFRFEVRV